MDARRVGVAVRPLAEESLDERFRLAVGLRPAGTGVAAGDPELGAGARPGVRAVAVAVIAEHAFDHDPALAVPADGAVQEGDAVGRTLASQQLCVRKPGVVVDRQVQVLPAGVARAGESVAVDALADREEAAELLDVDVHELARPLALV